VKVAIVHYWLVSMRGGEKVVEELCDLYPQADVFTNAYDPLRISPKINKHQVRTTFIGKLPRATRWYKHYLPLIPLALEELDLRGYDLIISSESGPAKGIVPPAEALHVCYCHTPMRYLWNMYHDYREQLGPMKRIAMSLMFHKLRQWDATAAQRVDHFVANSIVVSKRIRKYYRRNATVIYPPVDIDAFDTATSHEDYYLHVGELVGYKRVDLLIEACNRLKRRLIVVGGGEQFFKLRQMAGETVSVVGHKSFDELKHYYSHCRALLFAAEEDFGIVPVEAMASGRPVIAYGRGGATESVVDGVTGVHFPEQTVDSVVDAIKRFESMESSFLTTLIASNAQRFSKDAFKRRMSAKIEEWRELSDSQAKPHVFARTG